MDFPLVLERELFPVQAFFNAMSDRSLISTLQAFSNSIGAGFNDAVCEFPSEIEPTDQPFVGVKFYIFEEELVISRASFLSILEQVCSIYLGRHPEDRGRICTLLAEIEGMGGSGS